MRVQARQTGGVCSPRRTRNETVSRGPGGRLHRNLPGITDWMHSALSELASGNVCEASLDELIAEVPVLVYLCCEVLFCAPVCGAVHLCMVVPVCTYQFWRPEREVRRFVAALRRRLSAVY